MNAEKAQCDARDGNRPNILILCMDQWDTHMQVGLQRPSLSPKGTSGMTTADLFQRSLSAPILQPFQVLAYDGMVMTVSREIGVAGNHVRVA